MRMSDLHQSALALRAELELRLLRGEELPSSNLQAEEVLQGEMDSGQDDGTVAGGELASTISSHSHFTSPNTLLPSAASPSYDLAYEAFSSAQSLLSEFSRVLSWQGKFVNESHKAVMAASALPIYEILATCRSVWILSLHMGKRKTAPLILKMCKHPQQVHLCLLGLPLSSNFLSLTCASLQRSSGRRLRESPEVPAELPPGSGACGEGLGSAHSHSCQGGQGGEDDRCSQSPGFCFNAL